MEDVDNLLLGTEGIIRKGHFNLSSGLHTDTYIDKEVISAIPEIVTELSSLQVKHYHQSGLKVDTVVGLAYGAMIPGFLLARGLSAFFVTAKKSSDSFKIMPNLHHYITGKDVLVVEDILTTGKQLVKAMQVVRENGGNIVGVAAFCNRGGVTERDLGLKDKAKIFALSNKQYPTYNAGPDCPMCRESKVIYIGLGHG